MCQLLTLDHHVRGCLFFKYNAIYLYTKHASDLCEFYESSGIVFLAPGGLYPTLGPQGGYAPPVGYGPPPAYGGPDGYNNPPGPYGYQPGYEKPEEQDAFGGCLDKVGLALGGLVAAGGVAAAMHAINVKLD